MNHSDYGGGTPVLDVWRRDVGVAIGHVELVPKPVSLPLHRRGHGNVELALSARHTITLAPGASGARALIERHHGPLQSLAQRDFGRVVFLGSRGFAGLAAEAALKLLELSEGAVVTMANSPLGFRHGPKTTVNRATPVIVFVSNDSLARKYELDLLHELHTDGAAGGLLAIAAQAPDPIPPFECMVVPDLPAAGDTELVRPFVILAQLYAFHRSLQLGNTPDTPCASGRVNRIVKGVTNYPL